MTTQFLRLEDRNINDLKPDPNNAKIHPPEQIEEIAASILEFGFIDPLTVDQNNKIITGHGTHDALKLLVSRGNVQYEIVQCVVLNHLSERQQRAYVLAHNRIAQNSTWNFDKLSHELNELIEQDFNLDVIGFDEQELDSLLKMDTSVLPDAGLEPKKIEPEPEDKPKRTRAKSKILHTCPNCNHEFHA